jgi:hypothetical protein
MLRKFVGAVVLMTLVVGAGLAGEIQAFVSKIEDNKVTFWPIEQARGSKTKAKEQKTLPLAEKVKVMQTKNGQVLHPLEGGLNAKEIKNIDSEKGIQATLVTDKDGQNVTEIHLVIRPAKK